MATPTPERATIIAHEVNRLLDGAAAFRALPSDERREIANHTIAVATRLVDQEPAAALEGVDFPAFVAGLVDGVFNAIVDGSIEQMKAYAEMVKSVALAVDDVWRDDTGASKLRMGINRIIVTDGKIHAKHDPP
jgi:hypothetical protein